MKQGKSHLSIAPHAKYMPTPRLEGPQSGMRISRSGNALFTQSIPRGGDEFAIAGMLSRRARIEKSSRPRLSSVARSL
ncbi:hypothetical protein FRC02_011422 [Tulasnella sp. 418]|nr:hypothetical protein FRC02_011422 [Tulasnella sp. 418]